MTKHTQALRAALEALKKTRQTISRHLSPEHEMWWQEIAGAITLCEEALKIEPVFGNNYEQGLWSRRNLEAYLEDQGEPE